MNFAPWQPVFAIQQRLSPALGAASAVQFEFEPGLGRVRETSGVNETLYYHAIHRAEEGASIYLPIGVSGLPADSILRVDWVVAHLIGSDGRAADLGPASAPLVLNEGPGRIKNATHNSFFVRDYLYEKLKDEPVRMEFEYSLTLLGLVSANAIAAVGGHQTTRASGRCEANVNGSGTAVQLHCLKAGDTPPCATFFLEHVPSGARNPEMVRCTGDYAPFFMQFGPDALRRPSANLVFRDAADSWHLPVDGPLLRESHVVMRFYQPLEHFTRHVVIKDVRLQDWLPLPRFNPIR